MQWIQRGDEMINLNAARRLKFTPHGVGGDPGPTVFVEFDDEDTAKIHGPAAEKLWYLMECTETKTRRGPIAGEPGWRELREKLWNTDVSSRSPSSDGLMADVIPASSTGRRR